MTESENSAGAKLRYLPQNEKQRNFLSECPTGEGVLFPYGLCRWVRIYKDGRAIATFYVNEYVDWNTKEPKGKLNSLSQAVVARGRPPVPWFVHYTEWIGHNYEEPQRAVKSKEDIQLWWESWARDYIAGLDSAKRKALQALSTMTGIGAEELPEVYVQGRDVDEYRGKFADLQDDELAYVLEVFLEERELSIRQVLAQRLNSTYSAKNQGVRGGAKVYPVHVPGENARWQFPGFKVTAFVLAPVLWQLRKAGIQKADLETLRKAIDHYQKANRSG